MGWSSGFTIIEDQIIGLYDIGVLNKAVLEAVMDPFVGLDVDFGGFRNVKARDSKNIIDIICEIYEPEKYLKALENARCDEDDSSYNDELKDLYFKISYDKWGI